MTYIHPNHQHIDDFIQHHIPAQSDLKAVCGALLSWFDKNVEYSRLNAPFLPLQRSDLDVLSMHSGTCGDYSNLIVSVLQRLGYEAMYAYIHKDCYGDEQDHICAAVCAGNEWILIDATQPYRKWHGFACPHREYELLSPADFEDRMKKEEAYWTEAANRYGNERYAGLFYAPWIHDETIHETDDVLESVFYLLSIDKQKHTALYAYYQKYTEENGTTPIMGIITNDAPEYCFSCKPPKGIWDNDQWSPPYGKADIPPEWKTEMLDTFKKNLEETVPSINKVLLTLGDPDIALLYME